MTFLDDYDEPVDWAEQIEANERRVAREAELRSRLGRARDNGWDRMAAGCERLLAAIENE